MKLDQAKMELKRMLKKSKLDPDVKASLLKPFLRMLALHYELTKYKASRA